MTVAPERVRCLRDAPLRDDGAYVLYWMIAFRRSRYNLALEQAVRWAERLAKPLVILEGLRVGYTWASDRHHRFVIEGMRDNAEAFTSLPVTYFPYVEQAPGEGRGLVQRLGASATLVVIDDWPCFFIPRMVEKAVASLSVRVEAVDGNGLLPMRRAHRPFRRAFDFRRFMQKILGAALEAFPAEDPLEGATLPRLPAHRLAEVHAVWPRADRWLAGALDLTSLAIDHQVGAAAMTGGARAGGARLAAFVRQDLDVYCDGRNHPDDDRASGLSPWLHFGHISAHEVFSVVAASEGWQASRLSTKVTGQREGFFGMGPGAEAFLDQLITWRELGFSTAALDPAYDRFCSLPAWARKTLVDHGRDRREVLPFEMLEAGQTEDEVWNAAQRQLVVEGRMHNYLRMLWGKRLLTWTESPQHALDVMIALNDRYAVDGRDPNSYSGILWVLGKYDRAWGPERPVFGKVRFMTSESARKKLRIKRYLARWASPGVPSQATLF